MTLPKSAKEVFLAALDVERANRPAWLDDECAHDVGLRLQVEALLKVHDEPDSLLDSPRIDVGISGTPDDFPMIDQPAREQPGTQIGPYKLREQIGEGGMGVVYAAEQVEPVRRKVALKVIKPGMDSREVIARFESERQALAVMEHPHIARILDAGVTDVGRSYFVMELVRGIPITEYCDEVKMSPRERLALFADVCNAVQHAHQKGIIHRDIKPSNVLVTQVDGKPMVKVIDFGLAKATGAQQLTDKTVYTQFMKLMGTPAYMSPEQAGLSGVDIDTRSDIYSLGVLVFVLLTGDTPFRQVEISSASYEEICRRIREVDAPKPSHRVSTLKDADRSTVAQARHIEPKQLVHELRGELDWIVLKALEKDRSRRYASAAALSDDVQRYLRDEPVAAAAPSPAYVLRKYAHRHRAILATATAFILLLLVATVLSSTFAVQASQSERRARTALTIARQQEDNALAAERRMRRLAYASDMNLAARAIGRGNMVRAGQLLDRYRPENLPADQTDRDDLRGWEWRYLWQFCLDDPYDVLFDAGDAAVNRLSVSHNGRYLAIEAGQRIFIRDLIQNLAVGDFPGRHPTFSPTEAVLAYWGPSGIDGRRGSFRLWNATSRKITDRDLLPLADAVRGVAFSGDGTTLAVSTAPWVDPDEPWMERDKNQLNLVNVADGGTNRRLDAPQVGPGDGYPFALAIDLSIAVHGSGDAEESYFRVIDLNTGEAWQSAPAPTGQWIECLALSPDNKLLAVGHGLSQPTIEIWDVQRRIKIAKLEGHVAFVHDILFSNDRQLVSCSADQTVRIWDLTDLEEIPPSRMLRGHKAAVRQLAVLPNGQVISGCNHGRVLKWDLEATRSLPSPTFRFAGQATSWRIKPDQTALISCTDGGIVSQWTGDQYETERVLFDLKQLEPTYHRATVSQDAKKLAVGCSNGVVKLYDIARQEPIQSWETGLGNMVPDRFYADDQVVEVQHEGWWGQKLLWDLRQNSKRYEWPNTANVISLDGTVGLGLRDGKIELTRFDGSPPEVLPNDWRATFQFGSTTVSPDGRYFATTSIREKKVLMWDLTSGRQVGSFEAGFFLGPDSIGFSPEGTRLVAGGAATVHLFDVASQQPVLTLESGGDTRRWASFSPDGNIVTSQDEARIVYGWRAPPWKTIQRIERAMKDP